MANNKTSVKIRKIQERLYDKLKLRLGESIIQLILDLSEVIDEEGENDNEDQTDD